ncbi:MAG: competence/damage-inducible protein A [candidate division NC10 bacterium]|nr:competence/damage-inducible protein A [candidate division NC10 bacterium]
MLKVTIIAIGRELLTGRVRDANASWLARRVTALGGQVQRIAIADDDPAQVARELQRSLTDGASLVLTTGGLGPTADDRTLQGIALAFGCTLALHPQALQMVKERYWALAAEGSVQDAHITESRQKMAILPEGAIPLPNPVGAAPAVLLKIHGVTIVSLPGVPAEMQAIFEASVLNLLRAMTPQAAYQERTLVTPFGDESLLAPLLEQVMKRIPQVSLKSRATRFGPQVKLEVVLSTSARTEPEAEALLQEAEAELKQAIRSQAERSSAPGLDKEKKEHGGEEG